jgi:hypothetical protein
MRKAGKFSLMGFGGEEEWRGSGGAPGTVKEKEG